MSDPELVALLQGAKVLLFDFDGPICDVFAGLPAALVARRIERHLDSKVDSDDPLRVLEESRQFGEDVVRAVEDDLVMAELEAVDSAILTPGGIESMIAGLSAGKVVGVVSNNSSQAVARFFKTSAVLFDFKPLIGRAYANPGLMKPHPYPMWQALASAKSDPADAVFIGDSMTDIEVAAKVGVRSVALANKPGKRELFEKADSLVIEDMCDIAHGLAKSG
ncbi:HAD family hydrolase [Amycolatopsis sp. cmx-11-32]|uniref:HAD family hydrolase n=1 Tax=Amycolatopsis sp. cmx-11-32 TaxID=2785796 RepID=UPI0039E4621D